jgi:hypothetical protein
MAELNPKSILKKENREKKEEEDPTKAKRPVQFREGPNNVREFNKWATPNNFLNRSTEFGNETFAPLGAYARFSRRGIAQAASASPELVLSELQIVGFHRIQPKRSGAIGAGQGEENEDEEVKAEVCNMKTGLCWLVGVSSVIAGYLLGTMGGGRRKTRRQRSTQRRKQTRKRN